MKDELMYLSSQLLNAKTGPFAKHPLHKWMKQSLLPSYQTLSLLNSPNLQIQASLGQGNWATIPWIAIFDKKITTSASQGYYIVYLFSADMTRLYLSLNQGWLYFANTFGNKTGLKMLKRVTSQWQNQLKSYKNLFSTQPIQLIQNLRHSPHSALPKGYEAGHICGKTYHLTNLPNELTLQQDLQHMLSVFQELKGYLKPLSFEQINLQLLADKALQNIRDEYPLEQELNALLALEGRNSRLVEEEKPLTPFKKKHLGTKWILPDYQNITERKTRLGLAGEYLVLTHEKNKLKELGIKKSPIHISQLEGDTAGYDIKSFNSLGEEIFIEVKTTTADKTTPFYLTANELIHANKYQPNYYLYRIYDFNPITKTGKFYVLDSHDIATLELEPINYKVCGFN